MCTFKINFAVLILNVFKPDPPKKETNKKTKKTLNLTQREKKDA